MANLKAQVKCKSCGHVVYVSGNMIGRKSLKPERSTEEVEALFAQCPICNKEMILQIDNRSTRLQLSQVKMLMSKAAKSGEDKYKNRLVQVDKKLTEDRNNLMKEFDGRSYTSGLAVGICNCCFTVGSDQDA